MCRVGTRVARPTTSRLMPRRPVSHYPSHASPSSAPPSSASPSSPSPPSSASPSSSFPSSGRHDAGGRHGFLSRLRRSSAWSFHLRDGRRAHLPHQSLRRSSAGSCRLQQRPMVWTHCVARARGALQPAAPRTMRSRAREAFDSTFANKINVAIIIILAAQPFSKP